MMIEMKHLRLDPIQLVDQKVISEGVLADLSGVGKVEVDTYWDSFLHGMCLTMRAAVMAYKFPSQDLTASRAVTFAYPASWWQHCKQDLFQRHWLLRWICRRWPVVMAAESRRVELTVTVNGAYKFPEAEIAFPAHLGQSIYHSWLEQSWDERAEAGE